MPIYLYLQSRQLIVWGSSKRSKIWELFDVCLAPRCCARAGNSNGCIRIKYWTQSWISPLDYDTQEDVKNNLHEFLWPGKWNYYSYLRFRFDQNHGQDGRSPRVERPAFPGMTCDGNALCTRNLRALKFWLGLKSISMDSKAIPGVCT